MSCLIISVSVMCFVALSVPELECSTE